VPSQGAVRSSVGTEGLVGIAWFPEEQLQACIYMGSKGASRLIVSIYVNDLIITGNSNNEITVFKLEMKRMFLMSDLGLLSYYLGIEVH
jgi:hypothetical protein